VEKLILDKTGILLTELQRRLNCYCKFTKMITWNKNYTAHTIKCMNYIYYENRTQSAS